MVSEATAGSGGVEVAVEMCDMLCMASFSLNQIFFFNRQKILNVFLKRVGQTYGQRMNRTSYRDARTHLNRSRNTSDSVVGNTMPFVPKDPEFFMKYQNDIPPS